MATGDRVGPTSGLRHGSKSRRRPRRDGPQKSNRS
jgi:hypothetical protein